MGLLPMDASILPPCDDRVFKRILTDQQAKPVLIDLVSTILSRPVIDVLVRNNDIPPSDIMEKAERLDVNCRTDDGTQLDVEMQSSYIEEGPDREYRNLKGKSVYYVCDLHSSQPSKGIRRYDKLARTVQATFCTYTIFPERAGFVNSFSIRHDLDNGLLTDSMHLMFIELSKLGEVLKKPVLHMSDMEKWALFFRYANDPKRREKVNEVIRSKEALEMAGELLMSISQDERERAVFRSRRMYQTDLQSNLATAEDRGKEIGKEIGRKDRNVEIAKIMKANSEPISKIMTYTGLTEAEIQNA